MYPRVVVCAEVSARYGPLGGQMFIALESFAKQSSFRSTRAINISLLSERRQIDSPEPQLEKQTALSSIMQSRSPPVDEYSSARCRRSPLLLTFPRHCTDAPAERSTIATHPLQSSASRCPG